MEDVAITLDTRLGPLVISARCRTYQSGLVTASLELADVPVRLPTGMSVVRCRAAALRLKSDVEIDELIWSCMLEGKSHGSPSSGEHLAAQEWGDNRGLLTVGTEDWDILSARLSFTIRDDRDDPIVYTPNGIELRLRSIAPSAELTLHYVVAENVSPEPVATSAWYAVDVPHSDVLFATRPGRRDSPML